MSEFWSWYIIVLTLGMIFFVTWLIITYRRTDVDVTREHSESGVPTMGHKFDGIEEYDNPLPSWWFWLYILSIVFALVYLFLYPGLGNYKGYLEWTSSGQWQAEVEEAEKRYGPLFEQYSKVSIEDLLEVPAALKMGQRIFANNCSTCHGSNATGSRGYPNLRDDDWLYGGKPEIITASITNGRKAVMPAWGAIIGEDSVVNVAAYIRSIGGLSVVAEDAEKGKPVYQTMCIACHGPEAKGVQIIGAPDLTDATWLYGNSKIHVENGIRDGRSGEMPSFAGQLKSEKIHLVAAYVYSLSRQLN